MNLAKKSILFEIVNKGNSFKPIEAFTLIIPPESIEIDEPQRVSRTKTFGGHFEDDYGPDEIKINISGNTGNTEAKETFIPSDSDSRVPEKMTGRQAFFHFRNKIMRYKKNVKNYDKYEIIIYDLSLIPESVKEFEKSEAISILTDGYVVSLENFKMNRSKEKPLFFNYTIELIAIRALGESKGTQGIPASIPEPFNVIVAIRKALNSINGSLGKVVAIKNAVESHIKLVGQVSGQLTSFYDQTVDILLYPVSFCKLALASMKGISDLIQALGEDGAAEYGILKEEYYNIVLITQEMLQGSAALVTKGKEPDSYANSFVARTSKALTTIESSVARYEELTELESEIFAKVAEVDTSEEDIMVAYGHEVIVITQETTLEALALEYYEDASLQEIIAFYNDMEGVEDLVIGETLKVPTLSQFVSTPGNYVYSSFDDDIYGTDILLDENFNPVVGESGDYLTVAGPENIIQALNMKLNETLGRRLRLVVYGIREGVGGAANSSSPISYILSNIKDTAMQDPRIKEVENMVIKGSGDRLYISFNSYTIRRGDIIPFHTTL